MEIIKVGMVPPESDESMVLCIGKFDGLHIGHQHLLQVARKQLNKGDLLSVMSFHPHPLWVLKQDSRYKPCITPLQEKVKLLEQFGVDRVYEIEFTPEYATTTPETFVFEHLPKLKVKHVVVGEEFNFGKGRSSDVELLKNLCAQVGIEVTVVKIRTVNGKKISSSDIRHYISEGKITLANTLLNRSYSITGTVVHGNKLGRTIGFPTANLGNVDDYVFPYQGIYMGLIELQDDLGEDSESWKCLISAGFRPTVGGKEYKIEVYIMDFSGDLYDKTVTVSFISRIRDELKFDSLEDLIVQMKKDEEYARLNLDL